MNEIITTRFPNIVMILVVPASVPRSIISHRAYTVCSLSPMEPLPFPPGGRVPLQYCDPLSHIPNPGSYPYKLELSKVLELCSGWPVPTPGPLMLERNERERRMKISCQRTNCPDVLSLFHIRTRCVKFVFI